MSDKPQTRVDTRLLDVRTVRKNTQKAHRVAKNPQHSLPDPVGVLNSGKYELSMMPCTDDTHLEPMDWLEANASRFLFTDRQILDAAKPQFPGDCCSIERWGDYPSVCGIYFLVCNKQIVYVGQSNCIPRRIFQHRDNLVEFDSITWFEAPETFLSSIEGYYIERIRPFLNRCNPRESAFTRRQKLYAFPPPTIEPGNQQVIFHAARQEG